MKTKLFAKSLVATGFLLVALSIASLFGGCATKSYSVRPNPVTGAPETNVQYVLPAWASNAPMTLQAIGGALPFPYGEAVGLGGLGLSAVLAFYLRLKNQSLLKSNAALSSISDAALQAHIGEDLKRALVETASQRSVMDHAAVQTIVSKPRAEDLNKLPPNPL
jgi:hypothetical protein